MDKRLNHVGANNIILSDEALKEVDSMFMPQTSKHENNNNAGLDIHTAMIH